jgi:hypothetical protein
MGYLLHAHAYTLSVSRDLSPITTSFSLFCISFIIKCRNTPYFAFTYLFSTFPSPVALKAIFLYSFFRSPFSDIMSIIS